MTETSSNFILQEFQTLRSELLESKRYVFERPIVIAAVTVGGISLLEGPLLGLLPLALSALLVFNFWFTANRLMSAARIIAYIQLELEERSNGEWIGWETCLRYYRKWLKLDPDNKVASIEDELDEDAVPDAMMHYPPIYKLHVILIASAAIGSLFILISQFSLINLFSFLVTAYVVLKFSPYKKRFSPDWAKSLIERNRVIWGYVFKYMIREGIKIHKESS